MYSLKQAADAVGRGKPAILKAIKNGRISAKKDDNGQWLIDPAELHRVYPLTTAANDSDTAPGERQEPPRNSGIGPDVEVLRERIAEKDALIADLRGERDRLLTIVETQAAQMKQLTDQRPQPAERRRGWWRRLFGGVILASTISILLGAPATAGAVSVQPSCMAKDNELRVHTVIEYSYLESPAEKYRELWGISCSLQTGECNAAALSVVGLEKGKPISLLDFTLASGMKAVSAQGSVYTLAWGLYRTFTVDLPRKKVDYRESSDRWNAAGEGPCD